MYRRYNGSQSLLCSMRFFYGEATQQGIQGEIEQMYEVTIAVAVLLVAAIFGMVLKPNADQLRPLSPDEIRGQATEPAHHH